MNLLKLVFISTIVILASCKRDGHPERLMQIRGEIFGTYYAVSYYCTDGHVYEKEIDSLLNDFNQSMSYYVENSLISKINRNDTSIMDGYFSVVLQRSLEIYEKTDGAFDVTVAPLVNAWGFGFASKKDMTQQKVDSLLQFTGLNMVFIDGNSVMKHDQRVQFDFNAIAKGYASDLVAGLLESKGIKSYLVDIGGDLIVGDVKPDGSKWRIALERPAEKYDDPQEYDHIVEVINRAAATSGSYRRYYEKNGQRYSHTIDPKSGYPVQNNLLSVTVFANDCMTADAYATAFMVMGKEKARGFAEKRDDLEAFFIFSKNMDEFGVYATIGLEVEEK